MMMNARVSGLEINHLSPLRMVLRRQTASHASPLVMGYSGTLMKGVCVLLFCAVTHVQWWVWPELLCRCSRTVVRAIWSSILLHADNLLRRPRCFSWSFRCFISIHISSNFNWLSHKISLWLFPLANTVLMLTSLKPEPAISSSVADHVN